MKVMEFVEMYKKNSRIDIEKCLEVKKYISIVQKRQIAELVLSNCTSIVDGAVRVDSVERYLLFTIAVISMHTNLEFVSTEDEDYDAINDYDILCESDLLVKIIDTFKDDYASCQEILNMMTADMVQSSVTIEQKIGKFLDGVQEILDKATNSLVEKINMDDLLGNLQLDQAKLLDVYNLINGK